MSINLSNVVFTIPLTFLSMGDVTSQDNEVTHVNAEKTMIYQHNDHEASVLQPVSIQMLNENYEAWLKDKSTILGYEIIEAVSPIVVINGDKDNAIKWDELAWRTSAEIAGKIKSDWLGKK